MGLAVLGMDRHITDVDFHKVMDQEHADHAVDLDLGAGLIGQDEGIKRQMPRMFARVFRAGAIDKGRGAQDRLEAISLVEKGKLGVKTVGHASALAMRGELTR